MGVLDLEYIAAAQDVRALIVCAESTLLRMIEKKNPWLKCFEQSLERNRIWDLRASGCKALLLYEAG
jgi:hypothetical protein